jgi:uncharacterized protein (TIGR02453 family)
MSEKLPFSGFPADGLEFLADLEKNNNREWFQSNKDRYVKYVLEPAQDFVVVLGQRLKFISSGIQFDPQTSGRGSILRIYRDIRFSKDKTPYNTNLRLIFWEGQGKKMENPSYFIRFDPRGGDVYAGLYQFPKPYLHAYREVVNDDGMGEKLEKALAQVSSAGQYIVGGEQFKRVPAGYDPEHSREALLRYKGIYSEAPKLEPEVLLEPALVDACFERCEDMAPLHHWLVEVAQRSSG